MPRFSRWLVLIVLTAGCGGADQPVKVRGKVTLDGLAVEGATVTFVPEGKGGRNANGRTRADGSFELTTFAPGDGALPGDYKVVVEYVEPPSVPQGVTNQQAAMEAVGQGRGGKKKPPRYVIPPHYGDAARTPLRQKVPPSGEALLELRGRH